MILLLALNSSREPEWIYDHTEVLPHPLCQHKIRGSLSGMCTLRGTSASACHRSPLSDTSSASPHVQEMQHTPLEGSCWGDGAGASHRVHSLRISCAVHRAHSFPLPMPALSPHTAQVPHSCPVPPAYLLVGDAAQPQQHWGVSFPHPTLPLYSPLLTSLRQTAALQFCLSSTEDAMEETYKSLP